MRLQVARAEDRARATAVRFIVESSNDRRASASAPVFKEGRPIWVNGLNSRPSNSLTASPSKPQRTSDSLGRNFMGFGVDSSLMLLPLNIIIKTMIGGNMASAAASVDGATAPRANRAPTRRQNSTR